MPIVETNNMDIQIGTMIIIITTTTVMMIINMTGKEKEIRLGILIEIEIEILRKIKREKE